MATYTPNVSDKGSTHPVDDEDVLNLRPLLDVFIRWWKEILLLTLVAAAIGGGYALYQRSKTPLTYRAAAQVAIARITSNVVVDPTFQTAMTNQGGAQDIAARRASFLSLVKNGTIAGEVIKELSPMLDGLSPTILGYMVSASFAGDGASDLIEIAVVADTPEKATAIANSWAKHYVSHINVLYGMMPTEMAELVEQEIGKAQVARDTAQQAYEEFLRQSQTESLTRQIAEREGYIVTLQETRQAGLRQVISQTLNFRQEVIGTYMEAVQNNRLLAFSGEQGVNSAFINNLITAIRENRQLAFDAEQQARVQLFTKYAELELQNRLLAIQQEQSNKSQIFQAYSDADLQAKLAVFNQQVDAKVGGLVDVYAMKQRTAQLLDAARALQTQIEQAGEAGASSNALPLLLLKIEAYAAAGQDSQAVPDSVNLDFAATDSLNTDIASQTADIAVLIESLTTRLAELDTLIQQQSEAVFNNEGYQWLDGTRPEDDALYAAIQEQYLALFDLDELAQSANTVADGTILSQAIVDKYDELFGIGTLASASLTLSNTTPIYEALQEQYPSLFNVGDLAQLGDLLAEDSALDSAGQQKLLELMQPSDALVGYLEASDTTAQPIVALEAEIRTLRAALEQQRAQLERLQQERDQKVETYNSLSNKLLELTLQRTASGRELRLAAEATPPDYPVPLANPMTTGVTFGLAGFLLAVVIAFLSSYMDAQPFLSRLRPSPVTQPSHASR